jgi:hypothetical protein
MKDRHVLGLGKNLVCQTAARNGAMHLIPSKQVKFDEVLKAQGQASGLPVKAVKQRAVLIHDLQLMNSSPCVIGSF